MAYKRIHSKGEWRPDEIECGDSDIEPGMLVELNSDGTLDPHSTEGGRAERMVALEDGLQGNGVDTDYEDGDIVSVAIAAQHSEFNMIITGGESISIGEELISAGDGKLMARDNSSSGVTVQETIARALEAFSATADALIQVRLA